MAEGEAEARTGDAELRELYDRLGGDPVALVAAVLDFSRRHTGLCVPPRPPGPGGPPPTGGQPAPWSREP